MSIKQSIARCKKSIAQGSSRQVFYSKKYDVIIKVPYEDGFNVETAHSQTLQEKNMYEKMDKNAKTLFPILEFIYLKKGDIAIIMKKATTLYDLGISLPSHYFEDVGYYEQLKWFEHIKDTHNIEVNMGIFMRTMLEYNLRDLHNKNLGVCDGRLVILDFGW